MTVESYFMRKNLTISAISLIFLLALSFNASGCRANTSSKPDSNKITPTSNLGVRSIRGTPKIDLKKYRLRISGLVTNQHSYSISDLRKKPAVKDVVVLNCVEGWSNVAKWTGVPLQDILDEAGVKNEAKILIFRGADGYSTSLTLDDIKTHKTILAYKVNDVDLPPEHGYPLRLVVEGKYGYKWIKWVTSIEAAKGPFRGYWESFGYSNTADVK